MCVCMCVRECVRVHPCVRECLRAYVRVRICVGGRARVNKRNTPEVGSGGWGWIKGEGGRCFY